jgi:hypothetical protein
VITFTPPHTQAYYQDSQGRWRAELALQGRHLAAFEADAETELRALVVERLRAWVEEAGAVALGELLEQIGREPGPRVTLTRRAACHAALTEIENGKL